MGLTDCAREETATKLTLATRDQLASARSTAPSTSLSGLKAAADDDSEVESEIWMFLVGHLIGRSVEVAGRSNEDGWLDTTKASIATKARIGFERRIGEN
jgi:hypothetical protein